MNWVPDANYICGGSLSLLTTGRSTVGRVEDFDNDDIITIAKVMESNGQRLPHSDGPDLWRYRTARFDVFQMFPSQNGVHLRADQHFIVRSHLTTSRRNSPINLRTLEATLIFFKPNLLQLAPLLRKSIFSPNFNLILLNHPRRTSIQIA